MVTVKDERMGVSDSTDHHLPFTTAAKGMGQSALSTHHGQECWRGWTSSLLQENSAAVWRAIIVPKSLFSYGCRASLHLPPAQLRRLLTYYGEPQTPEDYWQRPGREKDGGPDRRSLSSPRHGSLVQPVRLCVIKLHRQGFSSYVDCHMPANSS